MKKIRYFHFICVALTLGFLACSVFLFPNALGRVIEGGRDLGLSLAFYLDELFSFGWGINPTVNDLPKTPFFDFGLGKTQPPSTSLPDNYDEFKAGWTAYWLKVVSSENLMGYVNFLGNFLYNLSYLLLIIIPFLLLIRLMFKRFMQNENNDYDKDSKPLRVFKWLEKLLYVPAKMRVIEFIKFLKEHELYKKLWVFIWLFNFNVITIILEFVAFYLYFTASFDVINIYIQVYKLFLDLSVPLRFIPVWMWVIVALFLLDRFRKKLGYLRLNHFEMRNRGFINARPIVTLVCGTMGKKKTTTITDMALSQDIMFKDKAFEKLLETDLKFPFFPWISLENAIKKAMQFHEVYNLATCRKFAHKRFTRWSKNPSRQKVYGYDYERYGLNYDEKLGVTSLWQAIEVYTQAYFIYIIQSSLLVSNYSIREDKILLDLGNFPLWNSDFFKRDSRLLDSFSRHSHIIDFDALRLGRKVIKDNERKDFFEFGVVVITEVGKERGNNLELSQVRMS